MLQRAPAKPKVQPKEGALSITNGEAHTLPNLMFDGLDGPPKLGSILAVTRKEGAALQVVRFDKLEP